MVSHIPSCRSKKKERTKGPEMLFVKGRLVIRFFKGKRKRKPGEVTLNMRAVQE